MRGAEQQVWWLAAHPIVVKGNSGESFCSSQMPEIEKRRPVVRRDACPGEYRSEMAIWVAVCACRVAMVLCFLWDVGKECVPCSLYHLGCITGNCKEHLSCQPERVRRVKCETLLSGPDIPKCS